MFQISSDSVVTQLPSPQFSDSRALQHDVNVKRTLNGSRRTYVKHKPRRRFLWQFSLSRMKALELRAFVECFHSELMTIVDHCDETWSGYLTNNPFELDMVSRALGSASNGIRAERVQVTLEFQAVLD